jgi:uncharacterized protein YjiS (DUF1127 family)
MIMSTTTLTAVGATVVGQSRRPSLFRKLLDSMVASREARARRIVAAELSRMSDQRLGDIGFSREQIAEIRNSGRIPVSYWI